MSVVRLSSSFRRRSLSVSLALILGVSAGGVFAAETIALPPGVTAGPVVEGISQYTLPNGLQVLLFPDPSKPTVTVNLTYNVGSVNENYGETGMAHLLEHLMFKGTPTHDDITAAMKKRGIRYNASTSLDRTNYFASFPANDATLDWVLAMEADRMVNSDIAKSDLDSEMTVVRNELERGKNNPGSVLFERLRSTAYLWHNYGNTTIGARSDVENVPIKRLQAFYHTWYQPDNATLVIAGRIDPAQALVKVTEHFGTIDKPARTMPTFYTAEPTQDGEREVIVRRSGDLQLVALAYHIPAATHPDSAALDVLANLLADTPAGRLHEALVETKLAAAAGAGEEDMHDPGLFSAYVALPKDGDVEAAQAALLAQIEQFKPATQEEVDAAKRRLLTGYEQAMTNVNRIGMALSESIAAGDWRLFFLGRDRIAKVTVDDVNRVAQEYFTRSNRTLGRFVPTDAPDRVEITAAPPAAKVLEGYEGRAAVAAGEVFESTPANIAARTQTFTIGNALEVSLLPKDTRGDTVVVNADFRFGDVDSLHDRENGALAGVMLMRGSRNMSREQIAEKLVALKTTGSISGGLQSASINLMSRRQHLAEALALAAEVLRYPSFDADEFEQLRLLMITSLEAAQKQPGTVAGQALAAHFDPWPAGHPLEHKSIEQSLAEVKAMTVDELRKFHEDFYGSARGQIAIVGDFDATEVKQQLQTLFADWSSDNPYEPIHTSHTAVAAVDERLVTPDKPNAVLVARSNLSLNREDPDYPALLVANHVFGGGALKSRLGDRIRQTEGLSYGVSSRLHADSSRQGRDDAGYLSMQAIAAPQNMTKVETAIREELARLVKDGITADELKNAVSGLLVQREQSRASDSSVAGLLNSNLYLDRSMQDAADFDAALKALTVEQVNAAIAEHFKPDTLSVYIAGDFAKSEPPAAKNDE